MRIGFSQVTANLNNSGSFRLIFPLERSNMSQRTHLEKRDGGDLEWNGGGPYDKPLCDYIGKGLLPARSRATPRWMQVALHFLGTSVCFVSAPKRCWWTVGGSGKSHNNWRFGDGDDRRRGRQVLPGVTEKRLRGNLSLSVSTCLGAVIWDESSWVCITKG